MKRSREQDSNSPSPTREQQQQQQQHQQQQQNEKKSYSPPRDFSIYVSDIARGTTEEDLKRDFSRKLNCPVYKVNLVKNKVTGNTRGFGFVRFYSMSDVYRALSMPDSDLPSYTDVVTGKVSTVKVSYADPKNIIYIANIPKDMSHDQILQSVNEMTRIPARLDLSKSNSDESTTGGDDAEDIDRKRRSNTDGYHDGYGWLTYSSHENAISALKTLQRSLFLGNIQLEASFAEPRIFDKQAFESSTILKVSQISSSTSNDSLLELFGTDRVQSIGPYSDVNQSSSPSSPSPDREGRTVLIDLISHEEADNAREKLNGYEIDGSRIHVEWHIPTAELKRPQKLSKPAEAHAAAQGYHSHQRHVPSYSNRSYYPPKHAYYAPPPDAYHPSSRSPAPGYYGAGGHPHSYDHYAYSRYGRGSYYQAPPSSRRGRGPAESPVPRGRSRGGPPAGSADYYDSRPYDYSSYYYHHAYPDTRAPVSSYPYPGSGSSSSGGGGSNGNYPYDERASRESRHPRIPPQYDSYSSISPHQQPSYDSPSRHHMRQPQQHHHDTLYDDRRRPDDRVPPPARYANSSKRHRPY